ncbi:hypothetical protein TWF128_007792 [Orbilia oligospora]|nr:hypothetical protein TWF128_007792 [Orbilia oligospora]
MIGYGTGFSNDIYDSIRENPYYKLAIAATRKTHTKKKSSVPVPAAVLGRNPTLLEKVDVYLIDNMERL